FTELKKICLSQKTLTIRLHELEEVNAIHTIIDKPKKQRVKVFYSLTQKGKQTLELAFQFIKI
ncbi:MAG: winged helix-turn-helix transcriptional regulator, partial [Nanoarchaeota archaeon]